MLQQPFAAEVHWKQPRDSEREPTDLAPLATAAGKEALPKRIVSRWKPGGSLGVFWVNVRLFGLFTRMFGHEAAEQVLVELAEVLKSAARELLPSHRFLIVERMDLGSLAIIFQDGPIELVRLMDHTLKMRATARYRLNQNLVPVTGQSLYLDMGCSLMPPCPEHDLAVRLWQALDDARQMAEGPLEVERLALMDEFRQLLGGPQLRCLYQPIVDLKNGVTLGWEALARGPREGAFCSPKAMFEFAEEAGTLFQLERCCREQAVQGLDGLAAKQKLFINIHPQTLGDPHFRSGETRRLLAHRGLSPTNVVFEITERHSIKDFALFHRTLDHYRDQGFLVGIDDVGTGFSGLTRIASLRPHFIKVDMSLVQGCHSNPVQRALLETMVVFAEKIGCAVIAEGIEDRSDLSCLVSMGMHYGQGYLLARPAVPKPSCDPQLILVTQPLPKGEFKWRCSFPIRQVTDKPLFVPPHTTVREVKALLDKNPISGVVVTKKRRPLGLVMSHHLDRQLGTQYGSALYYGRSVNLVMDPAPLIVDADTPVEQVARQSANRERFKLYDHIVVTEDGLCLGTVSVQKMLDAMAQVQLEMAKGANPLTGLPGGVSLEVELERRCNGGQPSTIIYADLDNFKVYNDLYGFQAGDNMIRLTAQILGWACRRHGKGSAFLGHVGGDDFLLFCAPQQAERLCLAVVRCFRRLVPGMYNQTDAANGYVEATDRDGKPRRFPLVSVSLGMVDCTGQGCDLQQLALRAAEVKRYAKSQPGNVFVRDRRQPLGAAPEAPEAKEA
ncbi:MAG: GGDEF domain-containing protein [Thermodesulfobacteriota bacterium]